MLRGSITALLTPFANGALDEKAFERFVDWQIKEGTHGLVPVGTTGESPTVTHEEHHRIIELCVKVTAKRVPVIAGAGSNSTDEAVALTRYAEEIGADADNHFRVVEMIGRKGALAVAGFIGQQHTAVAHCIILHVAAAGVFGEKFADHL